MQVRGIGSGFNTLPRALQIGHVVLGGEGFNLGLSA